VGREEDDILSPGYEPTEEMIRAGAIAVSRLIDPDNRLIAYAAFKAMVDTARSNRTGTMHLANLTQDIGVTSVSWPGLVSSPSSASA